MRVIRANGQNVSPSDDASLFEQIFNDGLFEDTTIASLGSNQVSIGAIYGIMQGRDFTAEAQTITVELPSSADSTGYIYVQFDVSTDEVISFGSALAPFTPTYEDINGTGTICQMIIAEYEANAVQVTDITPTYETVHTKGGGVVYDYTLLASGWTSAKDYSYYTINHEKIKADSIVTLTYPPTLTQSKYVMLANANIRVSSQTNGIIQLQSYGTVPTSDIPIQLIIE